MKGEDVKLGTNLNLEVWKHGIKNPPSKIKVNVLKDDKGVIRAEIPGFPIIQEKKEVEKKSLMKKLTEKVTKPGAKKVEEKPEVKTEEPKVEKKVEEKKEVKTEEPKVEKKVKEKKHN